MGNAPVMQIKIIKRYGGDKSWGVVCPRCGALVVGAANPYLDGVDCSNCGNKAYADVEVGYLTVSSYGEEPLLKCPYCYGFMPFYPSYLHTDGSYDCQYCKRIIFESKKRPNL